MMSGTAQSAAMALSLSFHLVASCKGQRGGGVWGGGGHGAVVVHVSHPQRGERGRSVQGGRRRRAAHNTQTQRTIFSRSTKTL